MTRMRHPPRPPKGHLSDLDQATLDFARKRQRVMQNGQPTDMSTHQILVQATLKSAISGNAHSQFLMFDEIRRAEAEESAEIDRANHIAHSIRDSGLKRLATARRAGKPEPLLLPHPADIVIIEGEMPRYTGPVTKDEWRSCQKTMALREAFLHQHYLHEHRKGYRVTLGDTLCLAHLMDRLLPERLRWSDTDWFNGSWRLSRLTRRDLLKETRQAWLRAGMEVRRGAALPPPEIVMRMLDALAAAFHEVWSRPEDIKGNAALLTAALMEIRAIRRSAEGGG